MEEKTLQAAGASKASVAQCLAGYGYRAAHLTKGRWYAAADLATVKGRNIFWFNPNIPAHRQKAARLPVQGNYL
jgi:hypothetical protein